MRGFTLLEVLVVAAVIVLLAVISLVAFKNFNRNTALDADTRVVVSVIEAARQNTLSSKGDMQYGVRLESNAVVLFQGTVYNAANTSNKRYPLTVHSSITKSLSGGGSDIVFKKLTGETDQHGSITVTLSDGSSKTIIVYKTGTIHVN
jgi:prepilin-type N-terminal cleavage/methylation domain-containing protein